MVLEEGSTATTTLSMLRERRSKSSIAAVIGTWNARHSTGQPIVHVRSIDLLKGCLSNNRHDLSA
jgi:hypothetical protein